MTRASGRRPAAASTREAPSSKTLSRNSGSAKTSWAAFWTEGLGSAKTIVYGTENLRNSTKQSVYFTRLAPGCQFGRSVLDGDRILSEQRLDLLDQVLGGRHLLDLGALGHDAVGVRRFELEDDGALAFVPVQDRLELGQGGLFEPRQKDADDDPFGHLLEGLDERQGLGQADPAVILLAHELALDPDELALAEIRAGFGEALGE